MAFSYGFFNAKNLDRTYTAETSAITSAVSSVMAFRTTTVAALARQHPS